MRKLTASWAPKQPFKYIVSHEQQITRLLSTRPIANQLLADLLNGAGFDIKVEPCQSLETIECLNRQTVVQTAAQSKVLIDAAMVSHTICDEIVAIAMDSLLFNSKVIPESLTVRMIGLKRKEYFTALLNKYQIMLLPVAQFSHIDSW